MDCTNGQTNVFAASNTANATIANAKGVCQPSMNEVYPVFPQNGNAAKIGNFPHGRDAHATVWDQPQPSAMLA